MWQQVCNGTLAAVCVTEQKTRVECPHSLQISIEQQLNTKVSVVLMLVVNSGGVLCIHLLHQLRDLKEADMLVECSDLT